MKTMHQIQPISHVKSLSYFMVVTKADVLHRKLKMEAIW